MKNLPHRVKAFFYIKSKKLRNYFMKIQALLAITCILGLSAPAYASHSGKGKSSVAHSDTHHHYKHDKHMLTRHGNHENHNPHHRNCGSLPGSGC